ncbi:MAG: hypothetical protein AMXMBFR44_1300 [Candidatus Campbellbacteria bacterium]
MKQPISRKHIRWFSPVLLWASLVAVVIFLVGFFIGPQIFSYRYNQQEVKAQNATFDEEEKKPASDVVHLPTPDPLKAIYMTQCVVGTPSFREKLVKLIDETELNAVIIDIKDFSGKIAFTTDNPVLAPSVSDACGARDMKEFIKMLHGKNIYVVGRITVFQDPFYSKLHPELAVKKESDTSVVWTDHKGLSFIDVGARPFWDYIIELSRESYALGFDELNYDYVRYPSDGNMKDIAFTLSEGKPKDVELETFFAYLYEALDTGEAPTSGLRSVRNIFSDDEPRPVLSVDLFGYTTTNRDDLGIGQLLERALPYFDYVMPMVYPSHYNAGFIGIAKPASSPYEVVKYSMDEAVRRVRAMAEAKNSTATTTEATYLRTQANKGHGNINVLQMRPWLQDFDLGATYTPEMVRAQMQATYDAGLTSWALWDAGNTYTRAALHEATATGSSLTPTGR